MKDLSTIYVKFNTHDEMGNKMIFEENQIKLELVDEPKRRLIGKLIKNDDGSYTYHKHLKEKHLFRKTNSWGLNDYVIQSLPDDTQVVLQTERRKYKSTVKDIKAQGEYLWFNRKGFEKQIFMSVANFM